MLASSVDLATSIGCQLPNLLLSWHPLIHPCQHRGEEKPTAASSSLEEKDGERTTAGKKFPRQVVQHELVKAKSLVWFRRHGQMHHT